ncbi:hypothetical protein AADEFJLK_00379 [Methylovulum psychrotolerans]|uniref:Uncharacterized protein n=1 Tax=Methylovulum psychrotolerans TaxID=1704499 RepID=A0A2S5CRA9_9GAMM|nr:hypothetical protein AADEFJLK_00379 [Methylovulum psychrotolerans]
MYWDYRGLNNEEWHLRVQVKQVTIGIFICPVPRYSTASQGGCAIRRILGQRL